METNQEALQFEELDDDVIPERRSNWLIDGIYFLVLLTFLISINGIQKFPVLLFVNKAAGLLLILISIILVRKIYIPNILKVFLAFIVVTFFSGVLFGFNTDRVTDTSERLIQLFVLLVAVTQYYIFVGNVRVLLITLVVNSVILISAGKVFNQDLLYTGNQIERYASITSNANGFAFQILLGFVASLYFWAGGNIIRKILLAAVSSLQLYNIAISGSRKSLVAFVLIGLAYIYFSFPVRKSFQYLLVIGMVGIFAGSYLFSAISDTAAIQRIYKLKEDSDGADIRKILYREAFNVFADSPFIGKGLDNFRLFSASGLYAHSNYLELLADTGIIGFILFYMVYIMVWRNSSQLKYYDESSDHAKLLSGIFKCIIILFLIVGLGSVQYDSITHWILLIFPIVVYEQLVLRDRELEALEEVPLKADLDFKM